MEGDGLGGNRNPRGAPTCTGCGHRRIYHTRLVSTRGGRTETFVPCSMPDCGCGEYRPKIALGRNA